MIWQDKRDGGDLWCSLRRRGKRYNKRGGKNAGRGLIPDRIDISERPLRNTEGSRASPQASFDNGKEFAAHQDIAHALKAKIFFATPYHAWERGLNENTNGLIRDFFPKRTDFSTIANAEVAKVERLLNARPRKSLGFRSPQEVFDSLAHS
jgi:IS30 family transposase